MADLKIADLLLETPSVRMSNYHVTRTPGQLLSLTSHLSFNGDSPLNSGQSPILNSPTIVMLRDRDVSDDSFCGILNSDLSVASSPMRNSPEPNSAITGPKLKSLLKRKFVDTDVPDEGNSHSRSHKMARTGLTDIFHFACLSEDSENQ